MPDNRHDTCNETADSSPLLYENNTTQHPTPDADAAKWSNDSIRTAGLAATVLILYAFADVLKYTATVQLIEVGVCREHYPNPQNDLPAGICKSPPVQQELAHLRGYLSALEAIVGLVLTLPYGLLVGRLGEPLLAGVNVVGYLLSCAWLIVHVPAANRSLCFFLFMAAQLCTEIVAIMLAATLLEREHPFISMILNFPLGLLCIVAIFMLRSDSDHQGASVGNDLAKNEATDFSSSVRRSLRILPELFHNRYLLVLLSTVPVAKMLNPVMELMFQYIPRKFDVSLAWVRLSLPFQPKLCGTSLTLQPDQSHILHPGIREPGILAFSITPG
uniref:Uncharacterized protein n=1 Tax=Talaromyces marneffei PM1 TaxID=1077442 RepID=A0A093V863_TALMA